MFHSEGCHVTDQKFQSDQGFIQNPWYYTVIGNGINTNPVTNIAIPTADTEFIKVPWNGGIIGMCIWLLHFISLKIAVSKHEKTKTVDSLYRLATCIFWIFIILGFTLEVTNSPNLMHHVYLICGVLCYKSPLPNEISGNK